MSWLWGALTTPIAQMTALQYAACVAVWAALIAAAFLAWGVLSVLNDRRKARRKK